MKRILLLAMLLIGISSCSKSSKDCIYVYDNPNIPNSRYEHNEGSFTKSGCDDLEDMINGGRYTECELQ